MVYIRNPLIFLHAMRWARGSHVVSALVLPFSRLWFHEFFTKESAVQRRERLLRCNPSIGEIMETTAQKSCWGVTVRAVLGFGVVLVVAYLFGGI